MQRIIFDSNTRLFAREVVITQGRGFAGDRGGFGGFLARATFELGSELGAVTRGRGIECQHGSRQARSGTGIVGGIALGGGEQCQSLLGCSRPSRGNSALG